MDMPRRAALLCLALGMGACTACAPSLTPATTPQAVPVSSVTASVRQVEPTDPLQIREVRLTETAGQRSVRFQFSQPPHGIDYFPLREPSRLVIDVKGPIASLPQVETYNTLDPLVSAVRIGSYQGRIRLVIDLESKEVPPFSVDQHESVLTAYIGHKKDSDMSATPKAQMSNTRGLLAAQAPPPDAPGADAQAQQQPQTSPTPADTTPESGQSGPAPVAPGQAQAPVYTGIKVSLDFRNADIHDVLRILAEVSGLNIIATDDVKARVTLGLVEVPWDQALDVLLQANGLEKTQLGNVLTVSTPQRLEQERNARLAAKQIEQKLVDLETVYLTINYVKATEVIELITREAASGGVGVALMSPRGTIAADSTSNILILRDTPEHIVAVRELIKNIDIQTPQVIIESYIVTASENLARDLGIQWGSRYTTGPASGNPTGVNFPGTLGVGGVGTPGTGGVPFIADFPAALGAPALDLFLGSFDGSQALNLRLSALETEGKARVISRPRVVTINNTPAQIRNRREVRVPIISGNTVVGGAGTTGGSDAFEEFDVGITLEVLPQISSDGYILLEINAESSELVAPSIPAGAGFPQIPDVLTRTASSNILIKAGDTFVLGGILQDDLRQDETGIPYLRNTPGLGWLFRSTNRSKTKDELLVFTTPRLTAGVSTAGLPTAQQLWDRRSREPGVTSPGGMPPAAGAAAAAAPGV